MQMRSHTLPRKTYICILTSIFSLGKESSFSNHNMQITTPQTQIQDVEHNIYFMLSPGKADAKLMDRQAIHVLL